MNVDGFWSGKLTGNNNSGQIEARLIQNGQDIVGNANIQEINVGHYSYKIKGLLQDRNKITLSLTPASNQSNATLGNVTVKGTVDDDQSIRGSWKSTIGRQGVFILSRSADEEPSHQEVLSISEILESLSTIHSKDISYDEHGVLNGFHEAEEIKNKFCDYAISILNDSEKYLTNADLINEIILNEAIELVAQRGKEISNTISLINSLIDNGIHKPDFPEKRKKYISQLGKSYKSLQQDLVPLEQQIRLSKIESTVVDESYFSHIKNLAAEYDKQATDSLHQVESAKNEVMKILNSAQDVTVEKGVEKGSSHFGDLCSSHKNFERFWAISILVSIVLLIWSVHFAFNLDTPKTFSPESILELTKRLALISIPSIFLRLSLTKYNAERNLTIVYSHREKVLEQYKTFEAGIGNDTEAKNTFRLEVARYIFSDPKSNYAVSSDKSATDININPITRVTDHIISQK